MNYTRVLNLIGLLCIIVATFWIPNGNYDNFIKLFPASRHAEVFRRYGNVRQEWGIITVPDYENVENVDNMLTKAKWGFRLLKAGFMIQFIALILDP